MEKADKALAPLPNNMPAAPPSLGSALLTSTSVLIASAAAVMVALSIPETESEKFFIPSPRGPN